MVVIQNNIKSASDLKDADPVVLTQILSKYKELKTNKEYKYLKAKFDGILDEKGSVTSATMEIIETVAMLFLGFIPFVWDIATRLSLHWSLVNSDSSELYSEIIYSLVFILLTQIYDEVTTLPFSLYSTFVIEQKHGFNKQTLALFFVDKVKMLALSAVLGGPITSAMIFIIKWGGRYFYFYVWAFFFVVSLVMMHVYPEYIAPLFNKYTPLDSGDVFESVKKLADDVSFPLTKLFVVDGSTRSAHSNAYFYGFFKNKRIVLFDTLVNQVDTAELKAILGHEIGHWKLWHSIQGFVIAQLYLIVMLVSYSLVQNSASLISAFGLSFLPDKVPVLLSLFVFQQVIS